MPYIAPQAEQHTAVGRTSSVTGHITNQGTMVITGTFSVQMATIKSDQSQRRRTLGRVSGIYDDPEAYELACAYRDVPAEVDALLGWCERHRPGDRGRIRSVLELAAGPAEHAIELARRGIAATALDLSPAMCERARERAARAGIELMVAEADMRDFRIRGRFDLAITMLNSLCHLLVLDDLVAHLRAVAGHLAGGGLYVMELGHPADHFGGVPRTSSEWDSRHDGVRAHVRWGGPMDTIDPITQVTDERVVVTVRDGTAVRVITDVVPNRFWTATEVDAAVRLAGGFTITARYGAFDDSTPLDAPDAWRMIVILRRDA